MKYKVTWIDRTEYEATIEAKSKAEAECRFEGQEWDSCEPTGFVEFEDDSLEIEEIE